ncbi:hypothetical protein [Pseudomonas putida]|uniref:hypothetical protein n=1 Tax=Pseudomonas putida TaxID=303 RepID=UPI00265B1333|nr:hypothetical protein [Pseudomonas putida]MCZ9640379.1 hypothetical protein [Pseudomonas putida]
MRFDAQSASAKLSSLRIPIPSSDVLDEVYQSEGDALSDAIERAQAGDHTALHYLKGIFFTILPGCVERIRVANLPQPSLPVLINIGKVEGPKFSQQLKQWSDSGCADSDIGRYLCDTYRSLHQQFSCPEEQEVLIEAAEIQSSEEPATSELSSESADKKTFVTRHVYGAKVALCFQSDTTRSGEHTIRIEAAEATASRTFNWAEKISIQLSGRELPGVLATFMQMQTKFDGKGHGAQNEKWFTIENQPGKVFISVNTKGRAPRSVPIGPGDCFGVVTLLIEQMLKNAPYLSADTLLNLVQRTAQMAEPA